MGSTNHITVTRPLSDVISQDIIDRISWAEKKAESILIDVLTKHLGRQAVREDMALLTLIYHVDNNKLCKVIIGGAVIGQMEHCHVLTSMYEITFTPVES